MSMSHSVRLATVVLFSLVSAVLVTYFVAGMPREAHAQGSGTATSTLTPEDLRILEKIAHDTRAADAARARGEIPTASMEEAQTKSRRVLSKAMRRAYLKPVTPVGGGAATGTSITPTLMRAGLAGATAGIWIHNSIMINNGIECGQTECAPVVVLDAQFLEATEGRASFFEMPTGSGGTAGVLNISKVEYDYSESSGYGSSEIHWEVVQGQWPTYTNYSVPVYQQFEAPRAQIRAIALSVKKATVSPWAHDTASSVMGSPSSNSTYRVRRAPNPVFEPSDHPTTIVARPATQDFTWENPVFDIREVEFIPKGPEYTPAPGEYVPSTEQNQKFLEEIRNDPEYDPTWAKPWLREDFRAPVDPQQREALWGPVVGTWTTPGGGECKEFESGAQLCDHPDGSTFVWISQDWTMWMQDSGGGKEWMSRPGGGPGDPPSGGSGGGEYYQADKMEEAEAILIARHALLDENEQPRGRMIPGARMENPSDVDALKEYRMRMVNEMELSKAYGRVPINGEGPKWREENDARGYWDRVNGNVVVRWPEAQQTDSTVFHREDADKGEAYFKDAFELDTPRSSGGTP